MLYCDSAAYALGAGSIIPDGQRDLWLQRASHRIDRMTYGRAGPAMEAHPDKLREPLSDACAQIADLLYSARQAQITAAMGLASATNDGISESYADAAASAAAKEQACYQILMDSLGSDPCGLLYAGVI